MKTRFSVRNSAGSLFRAHEYVYICVFSILNFFNVWFAWRKVSSPEKKKKLKQRNAPVSWILLKDWTSFLWALYVERGGFKVWSHFIVGFSLHNTEGCFWLDTLRKMINLFLPLVHLAQEQEQNWEANVKSGNKVNFMENTAWIA